jgi:hypothetical protein
MRKMAWLVPCVVVLLGHRASGQSGFFLPQALACSESSGILCTEAFDYLGYDGKYTGHDEPSILFYSTIAGSGNNSTYTLTLPMDPPTAPKQNGSGGTFNFQLRPAFWVSVALCDDQSAPNPGGSPVSPNILCKPGSDANIFDGSDPAKPDYIGKHPGAAFMEMQFYPPGWINGHDRTRWTSALTIDSFSQNLNTGQVNPCANGTGGTEYINFAFITKNGIPTGPPSPLLANSNTFTPNTETLFFNSGDVLRVVLQDSTHGLKITITDVTSGENGSMTASAANGFAQIRFDPKATTCDVKTHNLPRDFHPMYASSSEHTRVPWAAHSYNISFSDEIGHFEYCATVSAEGGTCTSSGPKDPPGLDENFCFDAAYASSFGLTPIGGCLDADSEFDGVPYGLNWPGTLANAATDASLHAQPARFTSPTFLDSKKKINNYSRIAFENDLPRVEFATNPPCQRNISNPTDPSPGKGCVNPPVGAKFYPFFSASTDKNGHCTWQEGGSHIPGTTNNFGGSSKAEFGSLLELAYPAVGGVSQRYNDFRKILTTNPCLP